MQLKVNTIKEGDISVEVDDEDIAIAHIIHRELLRNDDVVFAGVTPYHPLIKKSIMRLQTNTGDPVKTFLEGAEQAADIALKISTEIANALNAAS